MIILATAVDLYLHEFFILPHDWLIWLIDFIRNTCAPSHPCWNLFQHGCEGAQVFLIKWALKGHILFVHKMTKLNVVSFSVINKTFSEACIMNCFWGIWTRCLLFFQTELLFFTFWGIIGPPPFAMLRYF